MVVRFQFNYDSMWARLIACLLTANLVWRGFGIPVVEALETLIYGTVLQTQLYELPSLPDSAETTLVYAMCILPALVRIERPITLLAGGIFAASVYTGVFLVAVLSAGIAFPLAGPLLGLGSSVLIMGAMAWSSESRQRRHLELMESAKQQFTDMLVHDLKNRTSAIRLSTIVLEKQLRPQNAEVVELLAGIRGSVDRIVTQTNALLDIRKLQEHRLELHFEPVDISTLVHDSVHEISAVARLHDVSLDVQPRPEKTLVSADREICSRILANLLWNALRHAPKGTAVTVAICSSGNGVIVEVRNLGPAIPGNEQVGLFEPFVSHIHEAQGWTIGGTGLGLTFCKLAMEAHGGTLGLQSPWSDTGEGVCMTLRFPVAPA